jgi:predicted DNA-binding transcriptional regulator AlpA
MMNFVSQRHLYRVVIWQSDSCEYTLRNYFCMSSEPKQTPSSVEGFIDEKQLLAKLPISRRTLFNWRASGKIPCVRLGGRRILFHWPSVEAALLRHQHPAA